MTFIPTSGGGGSGAASDHVSDDEVLRSRTAYWALVTRMDAMIGEMLAALERNGFADNTLVVYTSDHGDQLGEHGLWLEADLLRGLRQGPCDTVMAAHASRGHPV